MARKGASSLHAQRVRTAANVVVQIALATLIVLMLNYLSFSRFGRWDLSRTSKYALSGLTRKFLSSFPVRGLSHPAQSCITTLRICSRNMSTPESDTFG